MRKFFSHIFSISAVLLSIIQAIAFPRLSVGWIELIVLAVCTLGCWLATVVLGMPSQNNYKNLENIKNKITQIDEQIFKILQSSSSSSQSRRLEDLQSEKKSMRDLQALLKLETKNSRIIAIELSLGCLLLICLIAYSILINKPMSLLEYFLLICYILSFGIIGVTHIAEE